MRRLALAVALALLLPCAARANPERPSYTAKTRIATEYFSTASVLLLYDDFSSPDRRQAFDQTWEAVKALLEEIDGALSPARPDSDVSRFNRLAPGQSITVSRHTANVLAIAGDVYRLSGGKYDPTVSLLVDLWGFSPRFSGARGAMPYDRDRVGAGFPPPEEDYIAGLRALTGLPTIAMEGMRVTKGAADVAVRGATYSQALDLGGIGKGYAVDQVVALLRERGYAYGHFSCGGSSLQVLKRATASKGAPRPAQWGVAIQKPRGAGQQEPFMRVFTMDQALSTSGDYEHTYTVDGVRYTHLIDPDTGYPINMPVDGVQRGICSATVFGGSAAFDDALSTALCAMGLEGALALMNGQALAGYGFVLVLYDGRRPELEYVTNLDDGQVELVGGPGYLKASETRDGKVLYTGQFFSGK